MARGRRGPGGRGRFGGGPLGDERPVRHGVRVEENPYFPLPRRASGWGVAPPSRHLWVGGLAPSVTASDLSELFLRCGDVEGVAREPGRNFAFVSFLREGDAVAAVRELQGARLAGAPVRIEFSKGVSVEHPLFIICLFNLTPSNYRCGVLLLSCVQNLSLSRKAEYQQLNLGFTALPPSQIGSKQVCPEMCRNRE
jgi:RNA recognition motif-containing protein